MKTEILEHDIKWRVDDDSITKLDEATIDHIKELIHEGYNSGEVVMYKTNDEIQCTYGWWKIVSWQDIACQLYNALKHSGDNPEARDAIKRFDENW